MYTIKLGSLLLNGQILLFIAFGMAGWVVLRHYERKEKWGTELASTSFHAFLIWLLVWKGSLLIFEPATVIQQPLSLLYFDGGFKGRWAATLAVSGYILYLILKKRMSIQRTIEAMTIYLLGGSTVYNLGLAWFEQEERLYLLAVSILFLVILLSFLLAKIQILLTGFIERGLWLCIGLVAIGFLNSERKSILLSFDFVQLVSVTAAGLLYWIDARLRKRRSR